MNIAMGQQYGPLQPNFSIDVPDAGYVALTGANNSGKSAVLQLIFRTVAAQGDIGVDRCALLLSDRSHVAASAETGGRILQHFNNELLQQLNANPMRFDQVMGPARHELPRLLLNHTDYIQQVNRLNQFLRALELPALVLAGNQQLNFEQVPVWFQGAGLRSLIAILASLTDPELRVICIDEPELGLEPKIQRRMRELVIDEAANRLIVVATHSHLFLDRTVPESTRVVERQGELVSVGAVGSIAQLHDIVFQLLGNDTSDLFFPGTYMIVEGATDQVLCDRALALLNVPRGQVKVLAAGGISKVAGTLSAVLMSLVPLAVGDSPYSQRIVALIDHPRPADANVAQQLAGSLGDRLYTLADDSIEAAIPEQWYVAANRDKQADLAAILGQGGNREQLRQLKRSISTQLAAVMTPELLATVPVLRDAVQRAAALGAPA